MNEGEFAARLGLIGMPNAAETIMLERDMRLVALTDGRYHAASVTCAESLDVLRRAKEAGPRGHRLRLDQPSDAERDRRRRLPHLLQAVAAAARRGRPPALVEALAKRPDRRGHVRPQSAGRRGASACRSRRRAAARSGIETMLPAGAAARRTPARLKLMTLLRGDVDASRPNCSACPAARSGPAARPT